jgi:hypothetical protein
VAHAIEQSPAGMRDGEGQGPLPRDYGAINAVYPALLTGVLVASRGRTAEENRISGAELVPLGAATFALSKVIARERIGAWVREPFVDDAVHPHRPRGRRVRRALGELVMCTRCVGAWTALGLVGLRVASPHAGRTVTAVLATSAANDFLQAGFKALCGAGQSK